MITEPKRVIFVKNQNLSKRAIPNSEVKIWRKGFLHAVGMIPLSEPNHSAVYIENGNNKVGYKNDRYDKTLVWNLPPVITCPCASNWCLENCYNADERKDVFPIDKWVNNYHLFKSSPDQVKNQIISTLNDGGNGKIAFRIHSSGDFFSVDYIYMWIDIIKESRHVDFWAYTRSWENKDLLDSLMGLRRQDNIQLFASHDKSMPTKPPKEWRKSLVYEPDDAIKTETGIICPEQSGSVNNCIDCGFCLKDKKKDVFFILH